MKKSSTIHLEERFWELIKNYQNDNKLSSRNDAIQLMLHEWEILKGVKPKPIEEPKLDDDIMLGLMDIKNNMK